MKTEAGVVHSAAMSRHLAIRVLILAALLVGRGAVAAEARLAAPDLFGAPHHHPAGQPHHHNDEDDRHDSPGSPCHHQDEQCNCGTPDDPTMVVPATEAIAPYALGCRPALPPEDGELPPLGSEVFHPPIA